MTWSAAQSDGGSPITGYIAEYRAQGDMGTFTAVNLDEGARSAVLTELAPFVMYDVRVRAVNAIGSSDPSATLTARTHPDGMSLIGDEASSNNDVILCAGTNCCVGYKNTCMGINSDLPYN